VGQASEAAWTRKTVGMPAVQIDVLDVWSEAERSVLPMPFSGRWLRPWMCPSVIVSR
jgi:hypothetical protein